MTDIAYTQPAGFTVETPAWMIDELRSVEPIIPDAQAGMHLVHRMATRNVREGSGGPFAAIIREWESGKLVSVGVNLVLTSGLSSMHAEVVAISLAQTRLATWDLGSANLPALQMIVNGRPCAMCLGSVVWSGVLHLAISVEGHEIEEITGFDEGPVTPDWENELTRRGIEVERDVLREESLDLYRWYRDYAKDAGVVVYNARGQSSSGRAETGGLAP